MSRTSSSSPSQSRRRTRMPVETIASISRESGSKLDGAVRPLLRVRMVPPRKHIPAVKYPVISRWLSRWPRSSRRRTWSGPKRTYSPTTASRSRPRRGSPTTSRIAAGTPACHIARRTGCARRSHAAHGRDGLLRGLRRLNQRTHGHARDQDLTSRPPIGREWPARCFSIRASPELAGEQTAFQKSRKSGESPSMKVVNFLKLPCFQLVSKPRMIRGGFQTRPEIPPHCAGLGAIVGGSVLNNWRRPQA